MLLRHAGNSRFCPWPLSGHSHTAGLGEGSESPILNTDDCGGGGTRQGWERGDGRTAPLWHLNSERFAVGLLPSRAPAATTATEDLETVKQSLESRSNLRVVHRIKILGLT